MLAGSQLTYTITVTNNGPSTASVAINDLLPRNFVTFVSCSVTPNGVCDKGAGLNRTIAFASLSSGQSGTATIVAATVATLLNGDTISNTSLVSNSSPVDTNLVNDTSSVQRHCICTTLGYQFCCRQFHRWLFRNHHAQYDTEKNAERRCRRWPHDHVLHQRHCSWNSNYERLRCGHASER